MLLQGGNAAIDGTTPSIGVDICFDETKACFRMKHDSMKDGTLTGVKRQGNTTMCASYAAMAVAEGVSKKFGEFAHGMLMTCMSIYQAVTHSTKPPSKE
jgi:hypothetical protein